MIEQRVELQAPVFRWLRLLLIVLKDKCRVLCRPVLVGLCRSVQHSAQAYKAQSSLCALFLLGGWYLQNLLHKCDHHIGSLWV